MRLVLSGALVAGGLAACNSGETERVGQAQDTVITSRQAQDTVITSRQTQDTTIVTTDTSVTTDTTVRRGQ